MPILIFSPVQIIITHPLDTTFNIENQENIIFDLATYFLINCVFELQHKDKNVRFKVSSEAAVATQDYRIAHATRKALRYTSDLHKTLAVRSGGALNNTASTASNSASASSSGVSSSPSRSSPRCLSSSEEEEMLSERRGRARSPKKYPAPPPPPPPAPPSGGCAPQDKVENASTSNLLPKNVTVKGID